MDNQTTVEEQLNKVTMEFEKMMEEGKIDEDLIPELADLIEAVKADPTEANILKLADAFDAIADANLKESMFTLKGMIKQL